MRHTIISSCFMLFMISVAVVNTLRIEVNEHLVRDYMKRDLQALEKLKMDKITEAVFNKNIDVDYDTIRFAEVAEGVTDQAFEVLFDATTRKGYGQNIAKFVVAIRYEIMPSEIKPIKVEVRNYKSLDDESGSDAGKLERVMNDVSRELSKWTHEMI